MKNLYLQTLIIILPHPIIDASLTNVVGKNMGKISAGMIMSGDFQIECVI